MNSARKSEDFIRFKTAKPRKISDEKIKAEIIHIDRFGNLITNLRREDLPEKFSIEINGKTIDKLQNFYAEAERGEIIYDFRKRRIFGNSRDGKFRI